MRKQAEQLDQKAPPEAFRRWWNPVMTDKNEGSVGGHDHCPKWTKNSEGRWGWTSGVDAYKAWHVKAYRDEFNERTSDHAKPGTGINHVVNDWHKPEEQPPRSNPEILKAHQEWLKTHKSADQSRPLAKVISKVLDKNKSSDIPF